MENNIKFCTQCGQQLSADAMFCTKCGAAQSKVDAAPTAQPEPQPVAQPTAQPATQPAAQSAAAPNEKKGLSIPTKAIQPLIAAAVALLMLIMAFLPIANMKTSYYGVDEVKIGVSAADSVTFMFDSFKSLDAKDLADSPLADKAEDIIEDMSDLEEDADSFDELSPAAKKLVKQVLIITYRAQLQSEDTKSGLHFVIAGLSALLYIAAAVALFIISLFKLLRAFDLTEKLKLNSLKLDLPKGIVNMIFFAVPMLLALTYYSVASIMGGDMSTSGGAVFTFILAALVLAAHIAVEFLVDKGAFIAAVKENMKKLISVGASLVLAIALLVSLSAPVLTANARLKVGKKASKYDAEFDVDKDYFASLNITEDQIESHEESREEYEEQYEEYKEQYDKNKDWYGDDYSFDYDTYEEYVAKKLQNYTDREYTYYTKSDVEEGKADYINTSLMNEIIMYDELYGMQSIYRFIPTLYIAAAMVALFVIWNNLVAIVNGKKNNKIPSKIVSIAGAAIVAIAVIIALIFASKISGAVKTYEVDNYSIGLSLGAIFAIVFAAGAVALEYMLPKLFGPVAPTAAESVDTNDENTAV